MSCLGTKDVLHEFQVQESLQKYSDNREGTVTFMYIMLSCFGLVEHSALVSTKLAHYAKPICFMQFEHTGFGAWNLLNFFEETI